MAEIALFNLLVNESSEKKTDGDGEEGWLDSGNVEVEEESLEEAAEAEEDSDEEENSY